MGQLRPMFALKNVLPVSMHFEFTLLPWLRLGGPETKQQRIETCPLYTGTSRQSVHPVCCFLIFGTGYLGTVRAFFQEKFPAEV